MAAVQFKVKSPTSFQLTDLCFPNGSLAVKIAEDVVKEAVEGEEETETEEDTETEEYTETEEDNSEEDDNRFDR